MHVIPTYQELSEKGVPNSEIIGQPGNMAYSTAALISKVGILVRASRTAYPKDEASTVHARTKVTTLSQSLSDMGNTLIYLSTRWRRWSVYFVHLAVPCS